MSDRRWRKGANGLWSSFDVVLRRAELREVGRKRISDIAERFAAVMARNGYEKRGRRWLKGVM